MRASVLAQVMGAAAVTTVAVLVLFWPTAGGAAGSGAPAAPEPSRLTLAHNGCRATLSVSKAPYKPGDEPVLEVVASNPTGEARELELSLRMTVLRLPSPMSRVLLPARPKEAWRHKLCLSLPSQTTEEVSVPTGVHLRGGTAVRFVMAIGDRQVQTGDISVGPVPGLRSLRIVTPNAAVEDASGPRKGQ